MTEVKKPNILPIHIEQQSSEDAVVVAEFTKFMSDSPNIAIAVAAIQALTGVVKRSKANTMMGLEIELKAAADKLKSCKKSSISLASGCELFSRYVTRTSLDIAEFEQCKSRLIERGEWFAQMSLLSRIQISKLVNRFIRDGQVILIHGMSRVVMSVLLHSAQQGKHFSVLVTEGRGDCAGIEAAEELMRHGIPVTLILDSAVGYHMEFVDLVLVGSEGVVENGGIINKIGTYQIGMVASALKRPFYVCAESYKFARLFPLNQKDLPESKEEQQVLKPAARQFPPNLLIDNPSCDYTPPQFITLLFTDLGILTPSAVSDELIKLYY